MVIFLRAGLKELDYFIHCMAEGLDDAYVMDVYEERFWRQLSDVDSRINETTDVITFNNIGIALDMIGGGIIGK